MGQFAEALEAAKPLKAKPNRIAMTDTFAAGSQQITPKDLVRAIEANKRAVLLDVLVTPELAQIMLKYNYPGETNRLLRKGGLESNTDAIREGGWLNTGEPIIFSDEKLLNDGQHRLLAVVRANLPAIMDIRFGVSRKAFAQTNSGMKRSAADALRIGGHLYGSNLATTARMVLAYEAGLPTGMYKTYNNGAVVNAVERWPDMEASMIYAAHLPRLLRNASTHALAFFAHRTANESAVRTFFQIVQSGEGQIDNPPHIFRETLLKGVPGNATKIRIRNMALGIIAWNAYQKGKPLTKLNWRSDQDFPKVDGLKL